MTPADWNSPLMAGLGRRVAAVLPALVLLWLAVWWASQ